MSRRKALIVDDERLSRSNLMLALAEHSHWMCVDACTSVAEARQAMSHFDVDLVLMDIRLPGMSGMSFAAELARLPTPPAVIFVTASDEHALSAFNVYALDYLLKPLDNLRFKQALHRAESFLNHRQLLTHASPSNEAETDPSKRDAATAGGLRHLNVRSVGSVEKIAVANINWISAAGNYVELHTHAGNRLHRTSLSALEAQLPQGQFMRVHRTALVRTSTIMALRTKGDKTFCASLQTGEVVPVSERFATDVRKIFSQ
jgi:two-component system, LytTR family, response regulator